VCSVSRVRRRRQEALLECQIGMPQPDRQIFSPQLVPRHFVMVLVPVRFVYKMPERAESIRTPDKVVQLHHLFAYLPNRNHSFFPYKCVVCPHTSVSIFHAVDACSDVCMCAPIRPLLPK